MAIEHTLSIDQFKKPAVKTGNDAAYILLMRLFLLDKGKDPNRPDMGIGIVRKWRFIYEDQIPDLIEEAKDQIAKYLPEYSLVEVSGSLVEGQLKLKVNLDGVEFGFSMDSEKETFTLDNI